MLKHIVLFKFKEVSKPNEVEYVIHSFLELEHTVPEIVSIEFGLNISPENWHQGFTHCFTLSFESLDSLASYQIDTSHLNFQKVLQPHMEKVFVVDYYTN